MYQVLRHSGRSGSGGGWRLVCQTGDVFHAMSQFSRVASKLRQGRVILEAGGKTLRSCWAPCLRTRW